MFVHLIRNCWEFLVATFLFHGVFSLVCADLFSYVQFASWPIIGACLYLRPNLRDRIVEFLQFLHRNPRHQRNCEKPEGACQNASNDILRSVSCFVVEVFIFLRSTKQEARMTFWGFLLEKLCQRREIDFSEAIHLVKTLFQWAQC